MTSLLALAKRLPAGSVAQYFDANPIGDSEHLSCVSIQSRGKFAPASVLVKRSAWRGMSRK
jgi:hypothetical protein